MTVWACWAYLWPSSTLLGRYAGWCNSLHSPKSWFTIYRRSDTAMCFSVKFKADSFGGGRCFVFNAPLIDGWNLAYVYHLTKFKDSGFSLITTMLFKKKGDSISYPDWSKSIDIDKLICAKLKVCQWVKTLLRAVLHLRLAAKWKNLMLNSWHTFIKKQDVEAGPSFITSALLAGKNPLRCN